MGATTVTTESTSGQAGRTRLHITPFNADLVDRFLPPNVRAEASNISLHSVQTFPERGFGYVELPTMEAQKLKKKFNGTILKGTKVKIEEARAEKKDRSKKRKAPETDSVAAAGEEGQQKKARVGKKEKPQKGEGVLLGFELPEGRHVKRGWEELPSRTRKGQSTDKSGEKGLSKKTGLFKTNVPPNATPLKSSTAKAGATPKVAKGSHEGKKTTIVKEFKKSSRLMNSGRGAKETRTSHFADGVGWMNENGDVVEAVPKSRRPQIETPKAKNTPDTNHDTSTREGMAARKDTPQILAPEAELAKSTDESADESAEGSTATSSVVESSSENDDSDSSDDSDSISSDDISESEADSHSDADMDDAQSRETTPVPIKKQVHPLEALFKRVPPSSGPETGAAEKLPPIDTSFNFFSGGIDGDDDDDGADGDDLGATDREPQTPHSGEDLEWRTIRSAAPTPDTAAVGKRFIFPLDDEPNDVDDTIHGESLDPMEAIANEARPDVTGEKVESEFRRWFYENRGDLNRAWKKRRREEKKLKRQRESRRLGRKLA